LERDASDIAALDIVDRRQRGPVRALEMGSSCGPHKPESPKIHSAVDVDKRPYAHEPQRGDVRLTQTVGVMSSRR
jgi:hypothetical protein